MKLYRVEYAFNPAPMATHTDTFECYVIAEDVADAAHYVSQFFVSGPHLNDTEYLLPVKATTLLVEQAFFREPHITERAREHGTS